MKIIKTVLIFLICCGMLSAADTVDSTLADTLEAAHQDSLPHPHRSAKKDDKQEKMDLVKRSFDHKQQVFLGIGMMVFVALIMTTAQSWNPRN